MTVKELMTGRTLDKDFAGVVTNDDFVLAVDISTSDTPATGVDDYEVIQEGITSVDAQISTDTDEKTYIRQGKTTTKTSTQRTFSVNGDRMISAAFQDFAMSHAVKFGTGQDVIRPYAFFNIKNGKGEKGEASIIVNSDSSGDAGATAEIDVDIMATKTPEEFTYAPAETTPGSLDSEV